MKTTSTYGATLIDHMGDDLTVVNSARVSFDKESRLECPIIGTEWRWDYHKREDYEANVYGPAQLKEADKRLIAYLATHGHWSPFAHPQLSFRVKAPIFIARQLGKHQVGLAWNEVSRRYVDSEPEFYVPEQWRGRAPNVKQGSSDADLTPESVVGSKDHFQNCLDYYTDLLDSGICPEQARMVLPQSMMTEWIWTGSLYAFARVVRQRKDPHAQRECLPIAEDIEKALRLKFPASAEALLDN